MGKHPPSNDAAANDAAANDAAAGHEAEFVALLTAGQTAIALVVRALMPGEQAAEEVVQQTNAKLWEKRADFELGTNFRAWASAIARYEVLNYRKQQARDSRLTFSDELEQTIAAEVPQLLDDLSQRQLAMTAESFFL